MGHFYTNATLMGPAGLGVAGAVGQMRRVAAITRNCGNFTVIFDRESEQQDGRAYPFMEQLTATLNCLGLYVTNHNDDVLCYRLYKSGKVVDEYDSCPNYFEGPPVPPEGGNAQVLCDAFGVPHARQRVWDILRCDRFAEGDSIGRRRIFEISRHFELNRHRALVQALELPPIAVGLGYTYLARDGLPDGMAEDDIISLDGETNT